MAATIKDIAKKLSISVSTVSYALNDGPRPVPAEVRAKVLETARELNYRPNRLARSLITRRSNTIGILPDLITRDIILSQFMQYVLNGIFNEANQWDFDALFLTGCDHKNPGKIIDQVLDGRIDGLVFLATDDQPEVVRELDARDFPYVQVSTASLGAGPSVGVDNVAGVRKALGHLVSLGHSKIAHLAGRAHLEDARQRLHAFMQIGEAFGIETRPEWIRDGDFTVGRAKEVVTEWMHAPERPTAVFAANDEMAIGAVEAVEAMGLRVPHDLSVVGFDDLPWAGSFHLPLTTLRQPLSEIGSAAARLLFDRLNGQPTEPNIRFEPQLIVRSSTGPTEDISE